MKMVQVSPEQKLWNRSRLKASSWQQLQRINDEPDEPERKCDFVIP